MYIVENTVSVSDLRKHTIEVMERVAKLKKPITVFSRSKPKIVLISYKNYMENRELQETLPLGSGADFFINTPEEFLIHEKNSDAVRDIRAERD